MYSNQSFGYKHNTIWIYDALLILVPYSIMPILLFIYPFHCSAVWGIAVDYHHDILPSYGFEEIIMINHWNLSSWSIHVEGLAMGWNSWARLLCSPYSPNGICFHFSSTISLSNYGHLYYAIWKFNKFPEINHCRKF